MHWLFPKKNVSTVAVHNPMHKYASKTVRPRITTVRPAPKTRSKSLARPRPRPMTLKAMPRMNRNKLIHRLSGQLQKMKNTTNKTRQLYQNKEDMRRFIENGIPQPRVQQKNKV